MWGETKRMFFNKNFLAAWLIACISIAIGQTYPSLKKAILAPLYAVTVILRQRRARLLTLQKSIATFK